jgi:hypothetical protein
MLLTPFFPSKTLKNPLIPLPLTKCFLTKFPVIWIIKIKENTANTSVFEILFKQKVRLKLFIAWKDKL